jgi:hypothetical protein
MDVMVADVAYIAPSRACSMDPNGSTKGSTKQNKTPLQRMTLQGRFS